MSRKQHVRAPDQDKFEEVIREVGGQCFLADIAEHFDISESTARRIMDGMVYQRKLYKDPSRPVYSIMREGQHVGSD